MKKRAKRKSNGKARASVTDIAFVKAWAKADSVADVAAGVGMAYSGAQARARKLRDAGVKLPKFARSARAIQSPASSTSGCAAAMPMLTVHRMPAVGSTVAASIRWRMRSAITAPPSTSVSGSTTPNSSPP